MNLAVRSFAARAVNGHGGDIGTIINKAVANKIQPSKTDDGKTVTSPQRPAQRL